MTQIVLAAKTCCLVVINVDITPSLVLQLMYYIFHLILRSDDDKIMLKITAIFYHHVDSQISQLNCFTQKFRFFLKVTIFIKLVTC